MNHPSPQPEPAAAPAAEERQLHSRDLAREVLDPGACPARRSRAARTVAALIGWGLFVCVGVVGGFAWAALWAEADIIFIPFLSTYLAFVFWIYTPTGYRLSESALEVLQPQNPVIIPRARIVGCAGSKARVAAWAEAAGAAWIAELPHSQEPPVPGARLLWVDPALPEAAAVREKAPRARLLVLPIWGVPLIHGGWAGRFWSPGRGLEFRYCRTLCPRIGLWLRASQTEDA